tara:strand:- start:9880 stop:11538 length:1659 start_codon:yes stop_codon:yes gene_type:complete
MSSNLNDLLMGMSLGGILAYAYAHQECDNELKAKIKLLDQKHVLEGKRENHDEARAYSTAIHEHMHRLKMMQAKLIQNKSIADGTSVSNLIRNHEDLQHKLNNENEHLKQQLEFALTQREVLRGVCNRKYSDQEAVMMSGNIVMHLHAMTKLMDEMMVNLAESVTVDITMEPNTDAEIAKLKRISDDLIVQEVKMLFAVNNKNQLVYNSNISLTDRFVNLLANQSNGEVITRDMLKMRLKFGEQVLDQNLSKYLTLRDTFNRFFEVFQVDIKLPPLTIDRVTQKLYNENFIPGFSATSRIVPRRKEKRTISTFPMEAYMVMGMKLNQNISKWREIVEMNLPDQKNFPKLINYWYDNDFIQGTCRGAPDLENLNNVRFFKNRGNTDLPPEDKRFKPDTPVAIMYNKDRGKWFIVGTERYDGQVNTKYEDQFRHLIGQKNIHVTTAGKLFDFEPEENEKRSSAVMGAVAGAAAAGAGAGLLGTDPPNPSGSPAPPVPPSAGPEPPADPTPPLRMVEPKKGWFDHIFGSDASDTPPDSLPTWATQYGMNLQPMLN